MSPTTICYHGPGCPDGFTAAWAAWLKYPDAEFVTCKHGEAPDYELLKGKDIIMLDFCYPREETLEIKRISNSFLVLDHHITAQKQCEDLHFCHFDMNKSGAGLAWEYFHPNMPEPWLIRYIQYRDLGFLWTKPESDHPDKLAEVLAAIDSYEQTFEDWSKVLRMDWTELVSQGDTILRYQKQLIERIVKNAHEVTIRGKKALCVNSPVFQSEVGNFLARQEESEVGLVWYQTKEGTKYSLRSIDQKADASEIARSYPRGGGHRNAAGFNVGNCNVQELLEEDAEV